MNKGRLTGTDDLNNVLTSGIYEISAPTTGVLNGKDIQYGILIVFSAGQRIQLLGNGLYGNAYFRTGRDNGRWYDWVSIYWHKIYSKRELGELLGNPKGTKSFSSWSEFTDFVNEMPIKTIQPFVSNFNAFAGEGFYGNVVQGLVIKQLEDAVFIFGIAIDGTLIFRKRNYPDVSTWEDPKIIIHSNNWHKIYFVTDLGGLLPTNGIKRTEYYETIQVGASFSIGAPTNEFVYVSHNDGEMMVYIDSTGIVTKIFSSADEIISISLKDNQIMITAIHYDLIVTISVLSF